MTIVRIGFKRLYNSPGCSLEVDNAFDLSFQVASMEANVYIGRKPKLGVAATGGTKYVVPGQKTPFQTLSFGENVSESKHIELLTEIICSELIEAEDDTVSAFYADDPGAAQFILDIAKKQMESYKKVIDLIAGTIGLRFHRQFVLEILTVSPLAFKDNSTPVQTYQGPGVEFLESIVLNKVGINSLEANLRMIGAASSEVQEFGASVLTWLLRAWSESDPFSKFMSLFIPLEVILSKVKFDSVELAQQKNLDSGIKSILKRHGGAQSGKMIAEYNKLRQLIHPPLTARFELLAEEAKIVGWELDISAFGHFNSIRNRILHRGDTKIDMIMPAESEIEEESRQLEDLAERYILWFFFEAENLTTVSTGLKDELLWYWLLLTSEWS